MLLSDNTKLDDGPSGGAGTAVAANSKRVKQRNVVGKSSQNKLGLLTQSS